MATHRWYVASIRPRFESKVAERLDALGFGTFLPLATVTDIKPRYRWGRWYEEKRKRQVIAFPTYLFVCFDHSDPRWRLITQDRDVRLLFGPDPERPRAVPIHHMAALFQAAQDRAMDEKQIQSLIEIGVAYRVTDGPFTGQIGAAEAVHGEAVRLGLSLFGRPMPVTLPVDQVERADV